MGARKGGGRAGKDRATGERGSRADGRGARERQTGQQERGRGAKMEMEGETQRRGAGGEGGRMETRTGKKEPAPGGGPQRGAGMAHSPRCGPDVCPTVVAELPRAATVFLRGREVAECPGPAAGLRGTHDPSHLPRDSQGTVTLGRVHVPHATRNPWTHQSPVHPTPARPQSSF